LSNLIADTLPEPLCLQTCCQTRRVRRTGPLWRSSSFTGISRFGENRGSSPPVIRPPDRPPAPPDRQAAPALAEAPERQDHLEAIIRIIMEATGFNRDEIQPDMDLRRDLSVRSSRLPIIMDAAERHFGITIELEDFIHVRTVRDIARKISVIVARQEGSGERLAVKTAAPARRGTEPRSRPRRRRG